MLSIDPSSPFTKGALLGDRIRLTDHFLDPGVFIRSMANRGALGGLSEAALQAALLMDASGRDVVLLETVGVGQAEVDIIDHADTVVLVLMPGSGDSIQALKAGVMEIPDVIVVNKADHPLTDTMVREIKGVLALGPREGWQVPIVRTEAGRGEGVDELLEKLAEHRAYIEAEGTLSERRRRNLMNEVLAIATFRMRRELEASVREDPGRPGAARPRRLARARSGERRDHDPRGALAAWRGRSPVRSWSRRWRCASRGWRSCGRRGRPREALRAAGLPAHRGADPCRSRPPSWRSAWYAGARRTSTAAAIAVGATYTGFAALTLVLHRRDAACGCFGDRRARRPRARSRRSAPRSRRCAAAAAIWHAHGPVLDRLGRSPMQRRVARHRHRRGRVTRPSSPTPSCRPRGARGARREPRPADRGRARRGCSSGAPRGAPRSTAPRSPAPRSRSRRSGT